EPPVCLVVRALWVAVGAVVRMTALASLALLAGLWLAAGDEGGEAIDVAVIARLLVLTAAAIIAALLVARLEELRVPRQVGLWIAGAELRLLTAGTLRRQAGLADRLAIAVLEVLLDVGGALHRPGRLLLLVVGIGLPELLLGGRDQTEIMLGVLEVVFRRDRVARGLSVARK